MSLFCLFAINDVFLSLFPSRIFFILHWSSLCYCLMILNSLVTCQVLVSSNHSPKSLSYILGVIYLNITDLIPSILICNQWSKSITSILLVLEDKSPISIKVYPIQSRSRMFSSNNSVYNLMPAHLTCLLRYLHEL